YEKNVVDGITKIPIVSLWYLDNTPSSSRTTSISKTDVNIVVDIYKKFPSRSTPPSPGLCLNCEINNEYLHHHRQELKKNVRSCLAAATMCFRFNSSMYLIHHEPPAQGLIIHLRSSGIYTQGVAYTQAVHLTSGLVTQLVTFASYGHDELSSPEFTPSGSVTSDT
ncbi:9372_t:CDS:2, partial [Funneliformis mosseae]